MKKEISKLEAKIIILCYLNDVGCLQYANRPNNPRIYPFIARETDIPEAVVRDVVDDMKREGLLKEWNAGETVGSDIYKFGLTSKGDEVLENSKKRLESP